MTLPVDLAGQSAESPKAARKKCTVCPTDRKSPRAGRSRGHDCKGGSSSNEYPEQ
jgi:hypothetical protein